TGRRAPLHGVVHKIQRRLLDTAPVDHMTRIIARPPGGPTPGPPVPPGGPSPWYRPLARAQGPVSLAGQIVSPSFSGEGGQRLLDGVLGHIVAGPGGGAQGAQAVEAAAV